MAVLAKDVEAIRKFRGFILSILSVAAPESVNNLGDLRALILLVAAADRLFYTMTYMIPEDFFFSAAQRSPDRRNLRDNLYAIATFLDHAG